MTGRQFPFVIARSEATKQSRAVRHTALDWLAKASFASAALAMTKKGVA